MSIPLLGLEDSETIPELMPDFGTPTDKQLRIDIPANIESGTYKVKFYADDNLLKTFKRSFYREGEIECSDPDGMDYYNKGTINLILNTGDVIEIQNDACCNNCLTAPSQSGHSISEYYCDGNKLARDIYKCPFGCENGKCSGNIELIEEEDPMPIPEPDVIEKKVFLCSTCELDGMCYPIGFRKETEFCSGKEFAEQKPDDEECNNPYECTSNICEKNQCGKYCDGCKDSNNNCLPFGTRVDGKYCSLEKTFKNQNPNEEECNNNYECSSNLCINNNCIEPNFLRKIINWFKSIF